MSWYARRITRAGSSDGRPKPNEPPADRTLIDEMRSFQPSSFRFRTSLPNRTERPEKRTSWKTVTSARPKTLTDEILSFMPSGTELRLSPLDAQKYSPLKLGSLKKQTPSRGKRSRPQCWADAVDEAASTTTHAASRMIRRSVIAWLLARETRPPSEQ